MRYVAVVLCAASLVFATAVTQSAWAAEWSPPIDRAVIALSFGAAYPGAVHRGIDLPADPGAEVRAPAAGLVTFAATIPADGGGTCNAVTVETADGLRISLLPLEGVFVQTGATVSAGTAVGRLAATGDDSSDGAHLHLGLRQGDRYIDPAPMLPGLIADTEARPVPPDAPATLPDLVPPMADGAVIAVGPGLVSAGAPGAASAGFGLDTRPSTQVEHAVSSEVVGSKAPVRRLMEPGGVPTEEAPVATMDTSRSMRLLRDAGVTRSAVRSTEAECADTAVGSVRWAAGGRSPVIPTPLSHTLAALAASAGSVIAIIARSKVLVRAR